MLDGLKTRIGSRSARGSAKLDEPLIAFVHIPKTAGGTLTSAFTSGYSKSALKHAGNYLVYPDEAVAKVAWTPEGWQAWSANGGRLTVGHVPYGVFREYLPPGTRYMTFLREPIDRVLSHYYRHMKREQLRKGVGKNGPRPRTDTLEEAMLELGRPELNNLATRFLCGDPSPTGSLPPTALADAKANLAAFAFVGLAERFEESLAELRRTLLRELPPIQPYANRHVNSDRPTIAEVPAGELELIVEHNQLDLELYEFACEHFESRLGTDRIGEVTPTVYAQRPPRATEPAAARPIASVSAVGVRPGRLVVFVNVPHTTGGTVVELMRANEPGGLLQAALGEVPVARTDPARYDALIQRLGQDRQVRVLDCRLPFDVQDHIPTGWNPQYVTFLRDPVERALSQYHEQLELSRRPVGERAARRLERGGTVVDATMADTPAAVVFSGPRFVPDNLQTRILSGVAAPFDEVDDAMLELAKENLRMRFLLVGLAERLDESFALLGRRLGYTNILYEDRPSEEDPRQDDPEVVEAARRANSYDVLLYRFAEDLFDASPEHGEPDFQLDLAALRQRRAGYEPASPARPSTLFTADAGTWSQLVESRLALLRSERELGWTRLTLAEATREPELLEPESPEPPNPKRTRRARIQRARRRLREVRNEIGASAQGPTLNATRAATLEVLTEALEARISEQRRSAKRAEPDGTGAEGERGDAKPEVAASAQSRPKKARRKPKDGRGSGQRSG